MPTPGAALQPGRFFVRRARSHRRCERKAMIDPAHELPVTRQARLLDVSRSSVYYPRAAHTEDGPGAAAPHRRVAPGASLRGFADAAPGGSRRGAQAHRYLDAQDGHQGAIPACQQQPAPSGAPRLSVPAAWRRGRACEPGLGDGHHLGFVCLAAVLDWTNRRILSWRLSNTLAAEFCVEALEEAIARYGAPRSSTPIRAASSPVRSSLPRSMLTPSPSAWTARAAGATTCSSNGCGRRSSTRRCISRL